MTRLLLVEDDRELSDNLVGFLSGEGFDVTPAFSKTEALLKLSGSPFDIMLLDIALPDGNGYSVCAAARENGHTPVIFLTASGDEYSVVAGLDMGADDYIAKPFRPRELLSRIRAVLRRRESEKDRIFICGDISVDMERGLVKKKGQEIFLSALEYRLLLIFITNRGKVLTRDQLLNDIWDASGEYVNDNTLTVYIKRLREKIEDDPVNPRLLTTVRGLGYRLQ